MNRIHTILAALFLLLASLSLGQRTFAQTPIISPELHADRTVTFRLRAPNAKEVKVRGEFSRSPLVMTKDEAGVWSGTSGPVEPNVYGYEFIVDGQNMPDPNNTYVRVGSVWFESQLDVPGETAAFLAVRNVPHGALHERWYFSKKLNGVRRFLVYTPPDYESGRVKSYPVLYLLHGYGDDERSWTSAGRAHFVMDNLLAEGKAKPALIVMPFGHSWRNVLEGAAGSAPSSESFYGVDELEIELKENIIPLVEREYRVSRDPAKRAVAGVSMGGNQALAIGLTNPKMFSYVAGFSSATVGPRFQSMTRELLARPEETNKNFKLIWVGCGSEDRLLAGNQDLEKQLTAKGIRHEWVLTPGQGHRWTLWRMYLRDLLPKLF